MSNFALFFVALCYDIIACQLHSALVTSAVAARKQFEFVFNHCVFCYGCPVGEAIIFCLCGFYILSFFFSSPILSGRRLDVYYASLDVYYASTHGVALIRI